MPDSERLIRVSLRVFEQSVPAGAKSLRASTANKHAVKAKATISSVRAMLAVNNVLIERFDRVCDDR